MRTTTSILKNRYPHLLSCPQILLFTFICADFPRKQPDYKSPCAVLSGPVVWDPLRPHGLQPARPLSPWGSSKQEYWSGLPCPPLGDLPNPGIKPRSPALQVNSSPSEPAGKPMNIGVGSLSLLQGIFPTQESNWGLLHYRWILYLLGYQGSP